MSLQPYADAGWHEARRLAAPVCDAAAPHAQEAATWVDGRLSPLAPWQVVINTNLPFALL